MQYSYEKTASVSVFSSVSVEIIYKVWLALEKVLMKQLKLVTLITNKKQLFVFIFKKDVINPPKMKFRFLIYKEY